MMNKNKLTEVYGDDMARIISDVDAKHNAQINYDKNRKWALESEADFIEKLKSEVRDDLNSILVLLKSRLGVFYSQSDRSTIANERDVGRVVYDMVSDMMTAFFFRKEDEDTEIKDLLAKQEKKDAQTLREKRKEFEEFMSGIEKKG